MSITLHNFSGAPRGWRVLIGLIFKGLDWENRIMDFSQNEHKSLEFMKLNPRAKVPVLVADDIVLRDSIAILAWLDRKYPEKPLFGEAPDQAAIIWQITMECSDYLRDANHQLLSRVFSSDDIMPEEGSEARIALQQGAGLVHAENRYLEALLQDGRAFLAGDIPSAADAIAFPEIRLVQRAVETKPDLMSGLGFEEPSGLYPKIAAWRARIADLPGVEATMPPHWK